MKQSVASLYAMYLKCSGNRPNTIESKERAFKFFSEWFDVPLENIRYVHGEDFRNLIRGRGVNNKTINLYVGHIYDFLGWCVKRQYVPINPWSELTQLPTFDKMTKPFTKEEIARMVKVSEIEWQVAILLGYCGMRKGEVLNLTKSELNYDKSYIELTPKKETKATFDWSIKNRRTSYIPFPENITLDVTYDLHHLSRIVCELTPTSQPYLIIKKKRYQHLLELRSRGEMTSTQRNDLFGNFDRKFKDILQLAFVRRGSFQGLRVGFINKLRKENYDLKKAQVLARHKSINTTAKYYAYEDEKQLVELATKTF